MFPLSMRRKIYLAGIAFLLVLAGLGKVGEEWVDKELHYIAAQPLEAAEIITPDTIEQMKNDVLNRLSQCESGGRDSEDGIVTFDPDKSGKPQNIPSYGIFQFKAPTVQYYHKKRTGEDLTGKEAILLALDDEKARELASWIIFDTDAGSKNDWVICSRVKELNTLVDFVKSHSN